MDSALPLAGLRVLELARGLPGAYAAKMLRDAGAEVVKLEPPGGDPLRRRKASAVLEGADPLPEGETGAFFHYINGGKRCAAAEPDAAAQIRRLASHADLVVEDGALAEAGLGLAALQAGNPGLSVLAISPWGEDGPYAGRPATEFTLQAEAGSTIYRGYADRPPFAPGGQLGDYVCGTFAAVAALAAWRSARAGGRGHRVDVSQLECLTVAFQSYGYIHGQLEPGVLVPTTMEVPGGEKTRDGWVAFFPVTDQQWQSFAEMIGRPELGRDPELKTFIQRFQKSERVQPAIDAWMSARTTDEIVAESVRRRIPAAPVGNGRSVTEMPQFVSRDVFLRNPAGFLQPRPPYRMGTGQVQPPAAAPEASSDEPGFSAHPAAPAAGPAGRRPLEGVRVLDLTAFWAGPVAGCLLAALGADVIKVEAVQRPDGMRFSGGFYPKDKPVWEYSPVAHGANTGKRAITLDLTREAGRELARRLIRQSDIVMENFSPRVMEQFGLGWEAIHALNPEAILLRMPAYGLAGPWRDWTGFAITIEQISGLSWVTGYPDRGPASPRGCIDPQGGMTAVFALLGALELRARGAGGQLIEVPLAEAGIALAGEQVAEYSAYSELLGRHGNRAVAACPQGVFAGSDGVWLALSVADDGQWLALATRLGGDFARPDWLSEAGRRCDEEQIEALLRIACAARPAAETVEELLAAGVPAAVLRNTRLVQNHPHLRARGFFHRLEHPVVGPLDYPNFPFRLDGRYLTPTRPAPVLGQHNEEVLGGLLGLSADELAALERDEIIGSRPIFKKS